MIDKAENNQIEPAIREFIATRLLYSGDMRFLRQLAGQETS